MIRPFTSKTLRRAFAHGLSLAAIGLLAACAAPATIAPAAASAPASADALRASLGADHGAVALRLSIAGPGASLFFSFWNVMEVRRLEGGNPAGKFEVAMSPLGATGSATYLGNLPAGDYAIEKFSSVSCGAICLESSVAWSHGEGLHFAVEAGKLTYFGSVVYEQRANLAAALVASGDPDLPSLHSWLATYHADLADMPVVIAAPARAPEAARAYAAAQERVMGLLNANALPDGDVLFTTLGGSLRRWNDKAGVATIDSGIQGRSSALVALTQDDWLVAGDFQQFRRTRDGGVHWQSIGTRLPYGVIVGLYRGHGGEVIALERRGQRLEVYAGSPDTDTWRLVSQHAFAFSTLRGGSSVPQMIESGRRLLIAVPPTTGVLLDEDSYAETAFEFPGPNMGVGFSGDGQLRCRCNRSGTWVASWLSRDGGRNWDDDPIERTAAVPQFRDASTGFGAYAGTLRASHDGGRTWATVYTPAKAYWPVLLMPYAVTFTFVGDKRVVGTDGLTRLYVSEDGGASWRTVEH